MDTRGMHYDYKRKLNKVDSKQNRNFLVPEIDWILNEALGIFIKTGALPLKPGYPGFEDRQRRREDLFPLVVNSKQLKVEAKLECSAKGLNYHEYWVELPEDYLFFGGALVKLSKEGLGQKFARGIPRQHSERHEESPFDDSSFEWGEVNIRFYNKGIRIFTDGTFKPLYLSLDYIKKHKYIHNAQDFLPNKKYTMTDGTVLEGFENCILPEHTHGEITDLAVLITTGDIESPAFQLKQAKINLTT